MCTGRDACATISETARDRNLRGQFIVLRVRIPVRLDLLFVIEMNVFGLAKFVEAFLPQLAAVTGLSHAAEWPGVVVGEGAVGPECACRDSFHRFHGPFLVFGV